MVCPGLQTARWQEMGGEKGWWGNGGKGKGPCQVEQCFGHGMGSKGVVGVCGGENLVQ